MLLKEGIVKTKNPIEPYHFKSKLNKKFELEFKFLKRGKANR